MKITAFIATAAILLSGAVHAQTADTAVINCVAPSCGFFQCGPVLKILLQGQSIELELPPEGDLLELYSCDSNNDCEFLPFIVMPNTAMNIAQVGDRIGLVEVPQYACAGYQTPMDTPVSVKKNRALPFKAELFDSDGSAVPGEGMTAPVIQVLFESAGAEVPDVSDLVLPAGQGSDGNQFVITPSGTWQFNLRTDNYPAPGVYTVFMDSGAATEYLVRPTCVGEFVIP